MLLSTKKWCQEQLAGAIRQFYGDPERRLHLRSDTPEVGKRVRDYIGELKCLANDFGADYDAMVAENVGEDERNHVAELAAL